MNREPLTAEQAAHIKVGDTPTAPANHVIAQARLRDFRASELAEASVCHLLWTDSCGVVENNTPILLQEGYQA